MKPNRLKHSYKPQFLKENLGSFLMGILHAVSRETDAARVLRSQNELERMIKDAPPVRSFREALSGDFGLIAEIKQKSPSLGPVRPENFSDAIDAYQESSIVRAISVLTNHSHFGMGIRELWRVKSETTKPVLRKDFITTEYQVFEARAFGADAILLMANILPPHRLRRLGQVAKSIGLDVLYESHTVAEIRDVSSIPNARICGINCRKLDSKAPVWRYFLSRLLKRIVAVRDLSIKDKPLEYVKYLPANSIKVAESGVTPEKVPLVEKLGFNAALVGNSLLTAPCGIQKVLMRFEEAFKLRWQSEEKAGQAARHIPAYS